MFQVLIPRKESNWVFPFPRIYRQIFVMHILYIKTLQFTKAMDPKCQKRLKIFSSFCSYNLLTKVSWKLQLNHQILHSGNLTLSFMHHNQLIQWKLAINQEDSCQVINVSFQNVLVLFAVFSEFYFLFPHYKSKLSSPHFLFCKFTSFCQRGEIRNNKQTEMWE